MAKKKQRVTGERYKHLAQSNLENYYASNDVKFLMTSAEQCWMAFRQLVIMKSGLPRNDYVPRHVIEREAKKRGLKYPYALAYSLHKTHYHYYTDDPDATESAIKDLLNEI